MIDKRMLQDQVIVQYVTGTDEYQEKTYSDPIAFSFVRVDHSKQYTGSGESRELYSNATVFFYADHTTNFDQVKEEWLQAKLIHENTTYIVKEITPCTDWRTAKTWSIEMDVI